MSCGQSTSSLPQRAHLHESRYLSQAKLKTNLINGQSCLCKKEKKKKKVTSFHANAMETETDLPHSSSKGSKWLR